MGQSQCPRCGLNVYKIRLHNNRKVSVLSGLMQPLSKSALDNGRIVFFNPDIHSDHDRDGSCRIELFAHRDWRLYTVFLDPDKKGTFAVRNVKTGREGSVEIHGKKIVSKVIMPKLIKEKMTEIINMKYNKEVK